jgi:hypothetical protein
VNKDPITQLRRPVVLAATCGLTVAGLATAIVPAALATPTHRPRPATTIRLLTDQVTEISFGTASVQADKVETTAGKALGADGLVCLLPRHKSGSCAEAINLTKGTLFFSGKASKTGASGRIVAGTGAYAGAVGTLVATSKSATKTLIVIRLRRR